VQDLVTFLHADGLITRSESLAIKRAARDLHENPVRILRSLNIASPSDIQKCFKVYFNFPLVTDSLVDHLTGEYASLIPVDLAIHYSVFGFGEEANKIFVGMEDPSDRSTREALHFFLDKDIVASAANIYQLKRALSKLYGLDERSSGLETVLDKARGAGAWSETEQALFEQILQERAAREEDERKSVTIVSVPSAQALHPDHPPAAHPGQPQEPSNRTVRMNQSASTNQQPIPINPPKDADLAEAEASEQLFEQQADPTPPLHADDSDQEPGYELANFDDSTLEPFDDNDFESEPDYVTLDSDPFAEDTKDTQLDLDETKDWNLTQSSPLEDHTDHAPGERDEPPLDASALKSAAQRAQVKLALCTDPDKALSTLNELLEPLGASVSMGPDLNPILLVQHEPIPTSDLPEDIERMLRPLFSRLRHLASR
jgi:hypothetical protein